MKLLVTNMYLQYCYHSKYMFRVVSLIRRISFAVMGNGIKTKGYTILMMRAKTGIIYENINVVQSSEHTYRITTTTVNYLRNRLHLRKGISIADYGDDF